MFPIRSAEGHKENHLQLVILERQEQVHESMVKSPFPPLFLSSLLPSYPSVLSSPLISSLPAGNLIKMTSRFLLLSPYTYTINVFIFCSPFSAALTLKILNHLHIRSLPCLIQSPLIFFFFKLVIFFFLSFLIAVSRLPSNLLPHCISMCL